jgi:hypothetical protein
MNSTPPATWQLLLLQALQKQIAVWREREREKKGPQISHNLQEKDVCNVLNLLHSKYLEHVRIITTGT